MPEDLKKPSLDNNISVTTLHYALAAEVEAIRDKTNELREDYNQLHLTVDEPKPFPWVALSTLFGIILTFLASIGGLIVQNMSSRIENIEKNNTYFSTSISESMKALHEDHNKKEDDIESRINARIEDIDRKTLQLLTLKVEFQATIDAIHQRQDRNERYIDQNREQMQNVVTTVQYNTGVGTINSRIDQLYTIYREIQAQQFQAATQSFKK